MVWKVYKTKFDSNKNGIYNHNAREDFEQIDHIIGHALELMHQIGYHGFFTTFDFGCRYEKGDVSTEYNGDPKRPPEPIQIAY